MIDDGMVGPYGLPLTGNWPLMGTPLPRYHEVFLNLIHTLINLDLAYGLYYFVRHIYCTTLYFNCMSSEKEAIS